MGVARLAKNAFPATTGFGELLRLLAPISDELTVVERFLAGQISEFEPGIRTQIQYLLAGTGKRLRPALALLAAGATGKITEEHITIAGVVELIHLATLVHDDVLDEADLRHGQPTANSRWGNEVSVLLGDCLFARALHLTANYSTTEACRRISAATGVVCAGELLQMQHRFEIGLTREQYLDIIYKKTGALFAVSCELGGLLNAAPDPVVKALQGYGGSLGIAYQIYDDCLDVFGQERQAGKSLGTDVKKGKLTLPFLLLLDHAGAERRGELGDVIFHGMAADRQQLVKLALSNGVVSESLQAIDQHVQQAVAHLAGLPANPCTKALAALPGFLGTRSRVLLGV